MNDFARHDLLYFKATKNRRLAALDWEEETGNVGAVAMIDTDYASEALSYKEEDLGIDAVTRRTKSGAGKAANKTVGLEWRSVDVSLNISER